MLEAGEQRYGAQRGQDAGDGCASVDKLADLDAGQTDLIGQREPGRGFQSLTLDGIEGRRIEAGRADRLDDVLVRGTVG